MRELIIIATRLKNGKGDWQYVCITNIKKVEKFEEWNRGSIIECRVFKIELPIDMPQ